MGRDTELVNQQAAQCSRDKYNWDQKHWGVRCRGRAWVRRGPEGSRSVEGLGPQNDSSVLGASGSQP